MANSSWMQVTNKVLELRGQNQITSPDNFNSEYQAGLTRMQQLARAFVEMCDRFLNVKRNNRDTSQEFQIVTQAGQPLVPSSNWYSIDQSVTAASIRYWSFFNVTPQSSSTTSYSPAQQIFNVPYREFLARYPDITTIQTGPPVNWILLPKSLIGGGTGLQYDKIMFYPVPDATYQINYQAKTKAVALTLHSDPVLWSPEYEHVLWTYASAFLEDAIGEGKGQNLFGLAEKFVSDYLMWESGPDEERKCVRTGMSIQGPMRGRRVSFWTDTQGS